MRKGFTLIELMIGFAIISILVALAFPLFLLTGGDQKFNEGQEVVVIQTGEKVVVLSATMHTGLYRYECRTFRECHRHREDLILEDTGVKLYQVIQFREFELRQIKRERSR